MAGPVTNTYSTGRDLLDRRGMEGFPAVANGRPIGAGSLCERSGASSLHFVIGFPGQADRVAWMLARVLP